MSKFKSFLVIAMAALVSVPAFAETQNVKVSGSIDSYAFYRGNFDLLDNNDGSVYAVGATIPSQGNVGTSSTTNRSEADEFFMTITQVQISADLTDNVSTVINLINQRNWTNGTDTNEFDLGIDLAYVQMKEIFYAPLTLTIGRQDLVFGRGFIVGWNPQSTQGTTYQPTEFTQEQAFDAIRATLDFNPWTLDFVYSKVREGAANPENDRDLYIANVNYKFSEYNAVAEAYYVGEVDRGTLAGSTGSTSTGDTHNNQTDILGGRVQFDPISQITLGAELAYQFGNYRAANNQPDRDREAWGGEVFGEYRWDNAWKPMFGVQYVYLSGESDLSATTGEYGSWNGNYRLPVYGWIHDYLEVYYGTANPSDQAAGQNQQHISLYGSIKPMEDLQFTGAFYYFWTAEDSHVTITNPSSATLSDELGMEFDFSVIYNYTADVTFTTYVNWFVPGDFYNDPFDATATQAIQEVKVVF